MDRRPLGRRGMEPASGLPMRVCACVFLRVAEEQEGGLRRPHREVCVLGLQDRGVRGLASCVSDVSKGDLDGVGSGDNSFP